MLHFEWDAAKARANLEKHGVSFTAAARIFDDMYRVEWLDTREDYGEDRFVTIGEVNAEVLAVAYTIRDEIIRIVSARRATRREKHEYHGNRSL